MAAMPRALDHPWDLRADDAIALQRQLRPLVQHTNGFDPDALRIVAGVDASYGDLSRAAVVVLSFPELQVVDQAIATRATTFPYVPGLLSFREVPVVLDALDKLRVVPGLLFVDGHGYAHPRRLGIASHLGLYLDLPTIGCAKSRLVGAHEDPGPEAGDQAPLYAGKERIGTVLRSKARTNPLYISVGHKVDLETAVDLVKCCLRGYRLPEPTRLADKLSKATGPVTDSSG
jgi:deoxyribonuclease V